jgi:hypothetical protein
VETPRRLRCPNHCALGGNRNPVSRIRKIGARRDLTSFFGGRRYVGVLSLALATLNLLPLPRLDGTHILSAVLDLVFKVDPENELVEHELEELEAYEEASLDPARDGPRRALQKRRWWHRAIGWTMTGVAVVCVGGGVVLGAL